MKTLARFFSVLLAFCVICPIIASAEIKELPIVASNAEIELGRYKPFSAGNSFFILDVTKKSLLQVDPGNAQVSTLFTFPVLTAMAEAPAFMDETGKLYILIYNNSIPKFAVIDLVSSPSSYTVRNLPSELSKLESGEKDQTQMFSGAATKAGKILILDNTNTIHIINSDDSYAGASNVASLGSDVIAERVHFALSPDDITVVVDGFKDAARQVRKIFIYEIGNNSLNVVKSAKIKGTYPESLLFSKNQKNIFIGASSGVERFNLKNLSDRTTLKSMKSAADGIYNLSRSNGKVFAVYLRNADKIYSLLNSPDKMAWA